MYMFMMIIAMKIMVMHMPIPWKTSLTGYLFYVSLFIYFSCTLHCRASWVSANYNLLVKSFRGSWDCAIFPS